MSDTQPEQSALGLDPRLEPEPNYGHSRYDDMLDKHGGSREAAIEHFLALWREDRDERAADWDARKTAFEEAALAHEQARQREEADAKARQEAEAEAERLQAEKKRPKAPEMDSNALAPVSALISASTYARKKLKDYEYIELYWFHPIKCAEASVSARDSDKTFDIISNGDGQLSFAPATSKGGKVPVKGDHELTWSEVSLIKPIFLRTAAEVGWKQDLIQAHIELLTALEVDPIRYKEYGDEIMVRYLADIRKEWHRLHEQNQPVFNIGIIVEERMRNADWAVVRKHMVSEGTVVVSATQFQLIPQD